MSSPGVDAMWLYIRLHLGRLTDAAEVNPAPTPTDHSNVPVLSTCLARMRAHA